MMLYLVPVTFSAHALPPRQQIVAIILGLGSLILIVSLVHKRKLKEEFAWMWLLTGFGVFVLSVWYDLLLMITYLIGAVLPTSALFFCGLLFLVGICLHFSIRLSALANQVKNLSQEFSLLRRDISELTDEK